MTDLGESVLEQVECPIFNEQKMKDNKLPHSPRLNVTHEFTYAGMSGLIFKRTFCPLVEDKDTCSYAQNCKCIYSKE